jgi:hypothetical protein
MIPRHVQLGAGLLLIIASACAQGVNDEPPALAPPDDTTTDAGTTPPSSQEAPPTTPDDDATAPPPPADDAGKPRDAAPSPADAANGDAAKGGQDSGPTTACTPVINELMTGTAGAATNEFVEIFNPCTTALDLSGFTLVYRAGTNASPVDPSYDAEHLFTWPGGATIAPGAHKIYAGAGFTAAKDGLLGGGMKDGDGAIALRDPSGKIVDAIGYGAVNTQNPFIEAHAAVANTVTAAPGTSIARHPDGHDTNDNQADFSLGKATPASAN